jgi:hypothetical protein
MIKYIPVSIQKVFVTAILLLLIAFTSSLKAQELDIKIKCDSTLSNNQKVYTVTISMIKGNAPFTLYLYDKEPLDNGKVIQKIEGINETSYCFHNLSSLKYYLCILDKQKNIKGEWIREI